MTNKSVSVFCCGIELTAIQLQYKHIESCVL